MVAIETLSSAAVPSTGALPLQGWRIDRVSLPIRADGHAAEVLAFHPRLTVISAHEVATTAERLAAVLHEEESGAHVEFTLSGGASYVLFRPVGARHRLINIDARQERPLAETLQALAPLTRPGRSAGVGSATAGHRNALAGDVGDTGDTGDTGDVGDVGDVGTVVSGGRLAADSGHGADGGGAARERAVIDPGRDTADPEDVPVVRQLCRIDQVVLWTAAARLLAARAEVQRELQAQPADAPPPPALASVPGSSSASSSASTSAPSSPSTAPTRSTSAPRRSWFRRKPQPPDAVSAPAREVAEAEQYWRLFAGDVDVSVAMRQRPRIEAASGLLVRLGALATVGRAPEAGEQARASLDPARVPALVCALVPEQNGDAGPHLVTVPGDAEPDAASMLLEQLAHVGIDRQLIIVTSAEAITEWARLESHVRRATLLHVDS